MAASANGSDQKIGEHLFGQLITVFPLNDKLLPIEVPIESLEIEEVVASVSKILNLDIKYLINAGTMERIREVRDFLHVRDVLPMTEDGENPPTRTLSVLGSPGEFRCCHTDNGFWYVIVFFRVLWSASCSRRTTRVCPCPRVFPILVQNSKGHRIR